ncbi:1764_t:CDS:2, partial [Entrophospora sp. SA101]
ESDDVNFLMTRLAPYGKPKCLGSGGSMVARLKLKGIDGRAPPGVDNFLEGLSVFNRWKFEAITGMGNLLKLYRAGDRALQLSLFNEESLVSVSHQLALITSLPFVHTAQVDQTWSFRGSKSRNKVSVGEPAEGSL